MAQSAQLAKGAKHNRQRTILIGAAAVGLLLLLYMRSRSSTASPNATSQTDLQTAAMSAAQQQAAQDAAMYGSSMPPTYGGGGGGGQIDTTGLADAISQGISGGLAGGTPAPGGSQAGPQITINTVGQPAGTAPAPGGPAGANGATVAATSYITTHKGGPFYQWYQRVFGTAPPARVNTRASRYQAWQHGLPTSQARKIPYGKIG